MSVRQQRQLRRAEATTVIKEAHRVADLNRNYNVIAYVAGKWRHVEDVRVLSGHVLVNLASSGEPEDMQWCRLSEWTLYGSKILDTNQLV